MEIFRLLTLIGIITLQSCIGYKPDHVNTKIFRKSDNNVWESDEDKAYWFEDGQAELVAQLEVTNKVKQAKNIIFFLGDGTSISTFTGTRLLKGYRTGNFEREKTSWDALPFTGVIKTYSTDNIVTDSAASSTAYLSGVKGNQGTIGVDVNVKRGDCVNMNIEEYHTQSILRDFQIANKSTGVVTTTRITHATPAGGYAHIADRDWENDAEIQSAGEDPDACDDIAEQLVLGDTGTKLNVAMGGGRSSFLPKELTDEDGNPGVREDGKNLKDLWLSSHNTDGNTGLYVGHRDELLSVNASTTDYLLGLFSPSHMDYKIDSPLNAPTLEEMTEKALEILQKNPNGYFLFVEGGLIDWAHHDNQANVAFEEGIEFEKAIAKAVALTTPEETLIVVTADHGQPVIINGYPARHEYVLGLTGPSDIDDMLFNTILYTNGPGYRTQTDGQRPDSSVEDYGDAHFAYPSTVPMEFSNHNGEDVLIFANGPFAHLFGGTHENSYIPQVFRYAACVGEGLQYCDS